MLRSSIHARPRPRVLLVLAAALGALVLLPAAASAQVYVYPSPSTTSAEPWTQISFRGVPSSSVRDITVSGSRSGVHSGHIAAHSDGQGASFVADQRFASGETVSVQTPLDIAGGQNGAFHFTTAAPAGRIPARPRPNVPGVFARFRTRPDLEPAAIQILRASSSASIDDIFVASQFGPRQSGPAIYAPDGTLLWYVRAPGQDWVTDFRMQSYQGRPALTWWQGYVNRGVGVGRGVIFDQNYRQVASVTGGNVLSPDLHEFLITPRDTALVTTVYPTVRDLSSVHGARSAVVFDGVAQEIDIKTGLVLFEWHSLDHVGMGDSYIPPPKGNGHVWDFFHINSVGFDNDGNLLISARNTWTVYKVDAHLGNVIWRLGGKHSSFKMGTNTRFAWQHDARARSDGAITLFDDEAGPQVGTQSRAIALRLDGSRHTATLVGRAVHSPALLAAYEGNNQQLANGHTFVGWGALPYFTEFDSRGRTLFDARFLAPTPSYRAYRLPWSGNPQTQPRGLAVATSSRTVTFFASWNGATAVASWRILAGPSNSTGSMSPVRTAPKRHFETAIHVTTTQPYLAAQALDARGNILATTPPARR